MPDIQHLRPAAIPKTSRDEQDREIHLYLIALELVSNGTCQSWGGPSSHGESEAVLPPGESKPRFMVLRESYKSARNWGERQDVIDQARVEVQGLRRIAPIVVVAETRQELEERMLEEATDLPPQLVVTTKQFGALSLRQVISARIRADRDPETGRPRPDAKPDDWKVDAARMLAEGFSLNAINFKLRVRRQDLLDWAREQEVT